MHDIVKWQQEFRSGPKVWCTWYRVDGVTEEFGNAYESEEAAQTEVEFCKRTKQMVPKVGYVNIHSLKLSKERWLREANYKQGADHATQG